MTSLFFIERILSAFVLLTLCLCRIEAELSVNATPEYVLPCRKYDPKINACIKQTFDHLRPYLIQGIPEIKLASIEPLRISKMQMENGHGPVRVRAVFSNMTIYGASNYTVLSVSCGIKRPASGAAYENGELLASVKHILSFRLRSDLDKYRIDIGLGIPRIEATGSYDVNGNVLLLPVRSRGEFWATFINITGIGKIYGSEVVKNDVVFMKTDRLGVDFKLGKARFKIKDYINGNNVLGEAMNQFLNENAIEIVEEMKPAAAQAISKHFKNFLNGAFLQIPLKVWLKDV